MRTLARNKRKFSYCTLTGTAPLYDSDGRSTGETRAVYADAVERLANISQATGYAQSEQFGQLDGYDKVIVFEDPNTPITESTVLFVDKEPEYRTESVFVMENGALTAKTISEPLFDYTVRRVSRSINSVSIAATKVRVS